MWRDSIRLAVGQWKRQLRRFDFWLVFLFLLCFFSILYGQGGESLLRDGGSVGVFAIFGVSLAEADVVLVTFAGLLMIVCDLPVKGAGLEFRVLRSSRTAWYVGQVLYSLLITVTYFFLVFLSQIVFYLPNLSFRSEWGSAVEDGSAFVGGYGMELTDAMMQQDTVGVFLRAFLLAVLLGMLFAMLCCSTNMMGGRGVGISICGFLIIWQRICKANGIDNGMMSPVGILDNYYQYGGGNVIPSLGYYIFLITLLVIVGQRVLYRTDMTDG